MSARLRISVVSSYHLFHQLFVFMMTLLCTTGKSTTVSMLTGLTPPTSGDVTVHGRSLRHDLAGVRGPGVGLGVCPQTNVVFESLTVEEHLLFFAKVRCVVLIYYSFVAQLGAHLEAFCERHMYTGYPAKTRIAFGLPALCSTSFTSSVSSTHLHLHAPSSFLRMPSGQRRRRQFNWGRR